MPTETSQRRLLDLLDAPPVRTTGGYPDLLGDRRQAGPPTGPAQVLMSVDLVSSIYERYWRPALGRIAKGLHGPSMSGEIDLATDLLRLRRGQVVLDVACGTGRFTRAFGEAVGPAGLAVGLDGSRTMLARAVEAGGGEAVAYLRADAVHPPLRPSTVDAVCCFAALHMFGDPEAALDSFASLLKPGGRLALLTSARRECRPIRELDTLTGLASGQRMFDRGEIGALLRDRGFTEISERYSGVTQIVGATRISMPE
ncbi:class I SAM-dependent methyltransferase [Amycolatopsis sp. YIM 10]|uniref:class I SAM-dependent methyltransferase n=1 Tax=Amycolatopsis sp. YIM 10 TaxID=2653857 RepID=UPI00128FE571|nr:methyltransferase domain-containing protein [Amycolatopsis sp. YIM 10]QFU87000.1 Demethylmenaquinone methyltransferase [Amycolatopsis sp. YIM 10]